MSAQAGDPDEPGTEPVESDPQLREQVRADADWRDQLGRLGAYIRTQRTLAGFSLRQLADRTDVSNPYLSQIERGLHEPSVRVIRSIASALDLSATQMLDEAGLLDDEGASPEGESGGTTPGPGPQAPTEAAIRTDPLLDRSQKEALLAVYRSYVRANDIADG